MKVSMKGTSRGGRKERELYCEDLDDEEVLFRITFENSKQEIVVDKVAFQRGWEEYKKTRPGADVEVPGRSPVQDNDKWIRLSFRSGELHLVILSLPKSSGATIAISPTAFESNIMRPMGLVTEEERDRVSNEIVKK